MERWEPSKNFTGYSVSNEGRYRSESRELIRSNGWPFRVAGKLLSPSKDGKGYQQVHPYVEKKRYHAQLHREVFEAFVRPLEPGEQVDHIDGNKENNKLENLQAVPGHKEHAKLTYERIYRSYYERGYQDGFTAANSQKARNEL